MTQTSEQTAKQFDMLLSRASMKVPVIDRSKWGTGPEAAAGLRAMQQLAGQVK